MHDAGAALAGIAADMRARKVQRIAQEMHEQSAILDVLLQLNTQRGLTVIMVTHNTFAATYGQRTLELRGGRIVRDVHADSEPSRKGPVPLHR